jgi:hypothetical protein
VWLNRAQDRGRQGTRVRIQRRHQDAGGRLDRKDRAHKGRREETGSACEARAESQSSGLTPGGAEHQRLGSRRGDANLSPESQRRSTGRELPPQGGLDPSRARV